MIRIIIATLMLSGCVYQSVSSWDIERATKACGGLENVVYINASAFGSEWAQCKTGTTKVLE